MYYQEYQSTPYLVSPQLPSAFMSYEEEKRKAFSPILPLLGLIPLYAKKD